MMTLPAKIAGSIVINRKKEVLETPWLHLKGSAVFGDRFFRQLDFYTGIESGEEYAEPEKTDERIGWYEDHSCYGKRDDQGQTGYDADHYIEVADAVTVIWEIL